MPPAVKSIPGIPSSIPSKSKSPFQVIFALGVMKSSEDKLANFCVVSTKKMFGQMDLLFLSQVAQLL